MNLDIILESFERWLNGHHLTNNDVTIITYSVILCVMLIVTIALLIYLSVHTLFWNRIGWFFEDLCHWFQRNTDITTRHHDEDLSDEDFYEIMGIIHQDNPPKNETK